jgi:hypothetical protein
MQLICKVKSRGINNIHGGEVGMNEDTEAQEAIRNTLKDQADQEIRSHAQNVLIEASRRLKTYGTADDADQRIMQAISEMQNHGELYAPSEPWETWKLL